MDKKRLLLAGGLAVAAIVVFTQVKRMGTPAPVQMTEAPVVEQVEYLDVLVAAEDVAFGSRISEESLQWKQWPAEAVNQEFISSDMRPGAVEELSGAVVRAAIYAGEPISEKKLVKAGDQGLMAALLKPGMRAVTTRISVDTAAGGFIQPGDRVDIIQTLELPRDRTNTQTNKKLYIAKTVFENVHVLAIDQTFTVPEAGGATVIGSTATFEMSQGDAELLQQTIAQGDISLTLRGIVGGRAYSPSTARTKRNSGEVSSLTVYRGGEPQYVAIKGGR